MGHVASAATSNSLRLGNAQSLGRDPVRRETPPSPRPFSHEVGEGRPQGAFSPRTRASSAVVERWCSNAMATARAPQVRARRASGVASTS